MLSSIGEFVSTHYDVLAGDLKGADTFLLAEAHGDFTEYLNGTFISRFATPGSVVLVEGVESLKPAKCRKTAYTNLGVLGWDIKEYSKCVEAPARVQEIALALIRKNWAAMEVIDWEKELRQGLQDRINRKYLEADVKVYLQETAADHEEEIQRLGGLLRQFDRDTIAPIQRRLDEIGRLNEVPMEDPSVKMQRIWPTAMDDPIKQQMLMDLGMGMMEMHGARNTASDLIYPQVLRRNAYIPMRTKAMVETLEKVDRSGRVFLAAGLNHLKQKPIMHEGEDAAWYDLQPLYDHALKNKNMVILVPKGL